MLIAPESQDTFYLSSRRFKSEASAPNEIVEKTLEVELRLKRVGSLPFLVAFCLKKARQEGAHDSNNLLTGVFAYIDLALRSNSEPAVTKHLRLSLTAPFE